MGVKGLTTLLHSRKYYTQEDISNVGGDSVVILAVDLLGLLFHLIPKIQWQLGTCAINNGGVLEKYLRRFLDHRIDLVFFVDGIKTPEKSNTNTTRILERSKVGWDFMKSLRDGTPHKYFKKPLIPPNLFIQVFITVIHKLRKEYIDMTLPIFTCMTEADPIIANYAANTPNVSW